MVECGRKKRWQHLNSIIGISTGKHLLLHFKVMLGFQQNLTDQWDLTNNWVAKSGTFSLDKSGTSFSGRYFDMMIHWKAFGKLLF